MDWIVTLAGLAVLMFAGDALVKGAVGLSMRLGIPALIVSLTIVAFGTSAPEMLVAISAVLEGAPGIAIGNVVGSNTANVLLVLGLPALISGLKASQSDTRESYVYMLIGLALFIGAAFLGPLTWMHGIILLGGLAYVLSDALSDARHHRRTQVDLETIELDPSRMRWLHISGYLAGGLIGLPLGAELLVEGSVNIAREYGVSESVIGLTLVAIGTSLPELATTVVAAWRRNADVAIGNVIGSNLFNTLAIPGIASLIGQLPVEQTILTFDVWVMLGASLLLFPTVFLRKNISRLWGAIFVAGYVIYLLLVLS